MFDADVMIGSHDPAFQQRPEGLDTVGVRLTLDVEPAGVVGGVSRVPDRGCHFHRGLRGDGGYSDPLRTLDPSVLPG